MSLNNNFHITILKKSLSECHTKEQADKVKGVMNKHLDKKTINSISKIYGY